MSKLVGSSIWFKAFQRWIALTQSNYVTEEREKKDWKCNLKDQRDKRRRTKHLPSIDVSQSCEIVLPTSNWSFH